MHSTVFSTSAKSSSPGGDEMFRFFVQNVADYAIFALDAGGHVTTWNEGAARFLGWSEEEIAGQHFSRFYPPAEV